MAWLEDMAFDVVWPDDGTPPRAEISYSVISNRGERDDLVMDWSEHALLLVRLGPLHHPAFAGKGLDPREPDRIIDSLPIEYFRIDKTTPERLARRRSYTFTASAQAKVAPSEWDQVYAYVAVYPACGIGYQMIADSGLAAVLQHIKAWQLMAEFAVPVPAPGRSPLVSAELIAALERNTEATTRLLGRLDRLAKSDRSP
jgi:hypothetical protein